MVFHHVRVPSASRFGLECRNAVIEPSLNSSVYLVLKVGNRLRFLDNGLNGILIQALLGDVLIQGLSIVGGLNIQVSLDGYFLLVAIILDVGITLVIIGTSRSVSEVHISVDVEESLVRGMVHAIVHILLVIKGVAVNSVIERYARGIGVNGREYQATLPCDVRSITALIQNVINHRLIAGCVLVDVR